MTVFALRTAYSSKFFAIGYLHKYLRELRQMGQANKQSILSYVYGNYKDREQCLRKLRTQEKKED